MKNLFSGILFLSLAQLAGAQTVSDNLNWTFNQGASTSFTSPDFSLCGGEIVNYTLTSLTSQTMINYSNQINYTSPIKPGVVMPNDPGQVSTQNLPMKLSFKTKVCNLRIHFTDLDNGESLSEFSTSFASATGTTGNWTANGTMNGVTSNSVDNSAGWVQWDVPLDEISFNYFRPSYGYGLVIDSIMFDCCNPVSVCKYDDIVEFINGGYIKPSGVAGANLHVNSNGQAVRSITVNLPTYVSTVSPQCLKCDEGKQGTYGSIIQASAIAGVSAVLEDPLGLGYSRTITWTFNTPTVVDEKIEIIMQFPGTLDLSCCANSVKFCMDVTIQNEDCTSCTYQVCDGYGVKGKSAQTDASTTKGNGMQPAYNDYAEQKSFTLSPNPTSGKVIVELLNESLLGGNLSIYSIEGDEVHKTVVNRMKETLQLGELAPGAYVVTIIVNDQVSSQRLIISK
jgi:hypothetical protein